MIESLFLIVNPTGKLFLEIQQISIELEIFQIPEEIRDEFGHSQITFQHDGAPTHYNQKVA